MNNAAIPITNTIQEYNHQLQHKTSAKKQDYIYKTTSNLEKNYNI